MEELDLGRRLQLQLEHLLRQRRSKSLLQRRGEGKTQVRQDRKRKQGGADRDAAQHVAEPAATTVPSKKDKSLTVKRKGAPWKPKKRG